MWRTAASLELLPIQTKTELGEALVGVLPVHIANPLANVHLAHGVDRAALEREAASFAIAVGLGVRRPGDK